jgi:hypothetical protein
MKLSSVPAGNKVAGEEIAVFWYGQPAVLWHIAACLEISSDLYADSASETRAKDNKLARVDLGWPRD